ncbi:MAG: hypothetical protein JWL84_1777 [Rhodospirillales bacterium]|nr:hypothetical protein [Rhodospirillales bacterium]
MSNGDRVLRTRELVESENFLAIVGTIETPTNTEAYGRSSAPIASCHAVSQRRSMLTPI